MTDEQERYTARKVGEVSLEAMKAMSKALNDWASESDHATPLLHFAIYVAIRSLAGASQCPVDDQESRDLLADVIRVMEKHVVVGSIDRRDTPQPIPSAKVGLA